MGTAEMRVMRRNYDQVRSGVCKIVAKAFQSCSQHGTRDIESFATRCFKVEICYVIATESG